MMWPPTDRPIIVIDPMVKFGRPQIRGMSTEAIASMVMAGGGVGEVADDYGISRTEVFLACWHEGAQGAYQAEWHRWADQAHRILAGPDLPDLSVLAEPPDQDDLANLEMGQPASTTGETP